MYSDDDTRPSTPPDGKGLINQLPVELKQQVFQHLNLSEKHNLAKTDKAFLAAYRAWPAWQKAGAKSPQEFDKKISTFSQDMQKLILSEMVDLPTAEATKPFLQRLVENNERKILALLFMNEITPEQVQSLDQNRLHYFGLMLGAFIQDERNAFKKTEDAEDFIKRIGFYQKAFSRDEENLYAIRCMIDAVCNPRTYERGASMQYCPESMFAGSLKVFAQEYKAICLGNRKPTDLGPSADSDPQRRSPRPGG